jgi:SIR2-like protein
VIESLVEAIRSRQAMLFVGAGISRSLGLPSWDELIGQMAVELGYDPEVFAKHGGYLVLAEYYEQQKVTLGPLRSWMDRKWHTDETKVDASFAHQAIIDLNFPIIYTTNYDRWLEIAHQRRGKPYTKVANVGDFTKIRDGTTQIVKLHGDFDEDHSLVLTETSYFDRLSFESPLDIKLRSDAIGKAILFVGYSLSDINVRYLLYKLHKMWADSEFADAQPKSYVFMPRPNPIQQSILLKRGITPIVSEMDDSGAGMRDFLEKLVHDVTGVRSY